jgi:hypothetical protein
LVIGQQAIVWWESTEISDYVSQQTGAHRLVGVTTAQQADSPRSGPEVECPDWPISTRPTDRRTGTKSDRLARQDIFDPFVHERLRLRNAPGVCSAQNPPLSSADGP